MPSLKPFPGAPKILTSAKLLAPLNSTPAELLPLWNSTGVATKPDPCKLCPFQKDGAGFTADWYPDAEQIPRLGFLLDFPSSDDIVSRRAWSGVAGYAWEQKYLKPFGLSLSDVMISHVLRCRPKASRFGKPIYPIGKQRRDAELTCRHYDGQSWNGGGMRPGGIRDFNPNLFVVTFHPIETLAVPALSKLLQRDVEKAVRKMRADPEARVLVLMGDEAKDLIAPWLKGSVRGWRGHFWRGSYPFGSEKSMLREPGFIAA